MKVLVVSSKYPPEYSGSGNRARNTYQRLLKKYSIHYSVLASSETSHKSSRYTLDNIPVRIISDKWKIPYTKKGSKSINILKRIVNKIISQRNYWLEAIKTFMFLIKNGRNYDLFHIFGNVNVTSAVITYAKITHKPSIVELVNMVENPIQYEPIIFRTILGLGAPKKALIVCISEKLKDICVRFGYSEERIWCRPNPVDENRFTDRRSEKLILRKEIMEFSNSDIVILHLAKFMPRKGQAFMIDVLERLPKKFKLCLAGPLVESGPMFQRDHDYFNSIIQNITKRNLKERVKVVPNFIEYPEKYINASDVFVMPSVNEGLGTPMLEALACGVPVVSNDIPGVFNTWIKNGINGFVCKLDSNLWAERIQQVILLNDEQLKNSMLQLREITSTARIDEEYLHRLKILSDIRKAA